MTSGRRWTILATAVVVQAVIWGIGLTAFTLWSRSWAGDFRAGHGAIMAANTGMMLGMGAFAPLAGWCASRLPLRRMIATGIACAALAFLLISRAGSMKEVIVLHATLLAAGMILTGPLVGQIIAVRLFQPKPGLAIGIVTVGMALGGMTMPLLVAHLIDERTWRPALLLLAALVIALLPLLLAMIPRLSPPVHSDRTIAPDMTPAGILRDPVFVGVTLVVTALHFMYTGLFFNLAPFLGETGISNAQTAQIVSIMAVVGVAGTLLFGQWADRIDYRLLLALAIAVTSAGIIIAAAGGGYWAMLYMLPPMGAVAGGLNALLATVIARRFGPRNFASANSLSLPFTFLASVGPVMVGIGRDRLGSYQTTFALLFSIVLIAVAAMVLLSRDRVTSPPAVLPG